MHQTRAKVEAAPKTTKAAPKAKAKQAAVGGAKKMKKTTAAGGGGARAAGNNKRNQARVRCSSVVIKSPNPKVLRPLPSFTFIKFNTTTKDPAPASPSPSSSSSSSPSPSRANAAAAAAAAAAASGASTKRKRKSTIDVANDDGQVDYAGIGKHEDTHYFASTICTDESHDDEDSTFYKNDLLALIQHHGDRHFVDVQTKLFPPTYPILVPGHTTLDWNHGSARVIKTLAELLNLHEAGELTNCATVSQLTLGQMTEEGKEDIKILSNGSALYIFTIGGDTHLDLFQPRGTTIRLLLKSGSLTKIGLQTAATATRRYTPVDTSSAPIIVTFRSVSRMHDPGRILTLSKNNVNRPKTAKALGKK